MKMLPFFLLYAFLLFSCHKAAEPLVSGKPARVTALQPEHMGAIERIAQEAQDTLPGFFRHLTRRSAGEDHFCVKYPFTVDDDSGVNREQLWLTGIQFKNGIYYGVLANTPRHVNGMKKGDTVIFDMDSITDWMYVRAGKIIGGDSMKYLLDQVPEYELSDSEWALLGMFY